MSSRMALEQADFSGIERLKKKLQEKYPNHNFDIPSEPHTEHKSYLCKDNKIFYTDKEGNVFCGGRYKEADARNPFIWTWRECHALVQKAKQEDEQDELPF